MLPPVINEEKRFSIEGYELGYPTRFHEGSASIGMFIVASSVANELMAESGFTAAEVAPGRAVMSLACVHYVDTDCGAYEEIACAFFVEKLGVRPLLPRCNVWLNMLLGRQPSFTWFLPVTEKAALECGIQMWGYPKTLEDIRHTKDQGRTVTTLERDGAVLLRYSVENIGAKRLRPVTAPVYSVINGAPHIGHLTQHFTQVAYGRSGELWLSKHPLMEPLRRLGLPKRPLISAHMGKLNFSMSAPSPLC